VRVFYWTYFFNEEVIIPIAPRIPIIPTSIINHFDNNKYSNINKINNENDIITKPLFLK